MQRSGSRSVILVPVQLAFPYQPQSWSDFQTYGHTRSRRGNPFRGKDLPPPLAFTNEGSRKRKGLRHYENAVTPSGVPIPLVGGIPAVRRNSPRFKHIGPRRRSDGAPCSPFDVRTLDAAAPEVRADTSNCKVMVVVVVFPRTVRPFGAWGAFPAQKPCAKKRGNKLPDETDVVRWHCCCRYDSPSLLPNNPDELLEPPCSWHDEYGVNTGKEDILRMVQLLQTSRGAASSLAAGVITRTIPNSSKIASEFPRGSRS
ncbi:hypothetical protein BDP81DRAFT_38267 [Colletotrichum phormii]|uniref:Uncharacterized protein n=1 Tax=Colletotrichum phormii TaxID=359342 RepID=A0AAI9ZRP5_9PEZI|nr:uncharacterized protein BDP81DRAFT_38267 [Colletotrichum phormii]KAK1635447.1 hypothetical protein BDP81DRAFT_38267 [Colletotrichum phormii]